MSKAVSIVNKADGLLPSDEMLKELLSQQKQQLSEILPELRASEKSEQVLDSAMLLLRDVHSYSDKLTGIKQQ